MIQSLLREIGQKRGALTGWLGLGVRFVGRCQAMAVGKAGGAQGKALGKRGKAATVGGIGGAQRARVLRGLARFFGKQFLLPVMTMAPF